MQLATAAKSVDSPATVKLREHLNQRMGGLLVDRMSWWLHWQELANYLLPRRYKWLITPNQATRGSPINQRIIDNTGTVALRVLAAGMMAGITSPGRPWFKLGLDDPDLAKQDEVKVWLDDSTNRMRTVLGESNFYTSIATVYEDLGCFGTAAMDILEDDEDIFRCYNSCLGEYFLANSARMAVDTKYRQFVMTVAQLVQKFGIEVVSPTVKQAYEQKGAGMVREVIVGHAIEPNDDGLTDHIPGMKNKPYREVYWEWAQGTTLYLSVKGFNECPFITPRWNIGGNDAYGRSPGMDALGDIKQLQVEQKRKAQAIDKMVNPPMLADVQLKNQPATLLPGGVTYVSMTGGTVGFKPVYEVKPQIEEMMKDLTEVQQRIEVTFFKDLFMMISQLDTVRSATEIDARKEEKLIQLGPVLERFEGEALDPALDRIFNIMMRRKMLMPVPQALSKQHVKIEYVSILAQAQRAAMTTGLERFAQFVGSVAALNPEAADNMNIDELIDEYADMMGIPAKVVRAMAEVLKIREQRAKQQQQQQMMEQTMQGVQGAKVLSEADVGGGQNALSAMLGGGAQ